MNYQKTIKDKNGIVIQDGDVLKLTTKTRFHGQRTNYHNRFVEIDQFGKIKLVKKHNGITYGEHLYHTNKNGEISNLEIVGNIKNEPDLLFS